MAPAVLVIRISFDDVRLLTVILPGAARLMIPLPALINEPSTRLMEPLLNSPVAE
jgi:hypothetical protein